jgi:CheY-like chemotaxis protein
MGKAARARRAKIRHRPNAPGKGPAGGVEPGCCRILTYKLLLDPASQQTCGEFAAAVMASRKLVLHFGYDELLSDARIMVLEDAGYEAVAVRTSSAALHVLRTRPVRLVLVCHSVPGEELARLLRQTKQAKPQVPAVVIHLGGLVQPQRSLAAGFIDGLRGPEHLLCQVAACLAPRHTIAAAT